MKHPRPSSLRRTKFSSVPLRFESPKRSAWPFLSNARVNQGRRRQPSAGFSLVEVTIAVGLVSYTLLALLGLFTVALSSSRDSTVETALAQIVLHASSTYDSALPERVLSYSFAGSPVEAASPEKHFEVRMVARPSSGATIANTSTNLHLLTLSISSPQNPGVTNVVQSSVFLP